MQFHMFCLGSQIHVTNVFSMEPERVRGHLLKQGWSRQKTRIDHPFGQR